MDTVPKPADPQAPRSFWDTILTTTPVVLTVVATVLAGISSSEMTQAQYHRALAAQNQSKASDQWGFFQAKRMRGAGMVAAFDMLPVTFKPEKVDPGQLQAASQRLAKELQHGETEAGALVKAMRSSSKDSADASPRQAAQELLHTARETARVATRNGEAIARQLSQQQVKDAFAYLAQDRLPDVADTPFKNEDLEQAIQGIGNRQPEDELSLVIRRISDEDIARAIDVAEENAQRVDSASKPAGKVYEDLGRLVNSEVAQAAAFHLAARSLRLALLDGAAGDHSPEASRAAAQLEKIASAAAETAGELNGIFRAGVYGFNARRQEREARYNQKAAAFYEVQVRKRSIDSDRHRGRSKLFFYGMLTAQAGVTVASLSLAVRRRSVLWSLAGLAGISAVLFSGYVYLYI